MFSLSIRSIHTCIRYQLQPSFVNFRLYSPKAPLSNTMSNWIIEKWLQLELKVVRFKKFDDQVANNDPSKTQSNDRPRSHATHISRRSHMPHNTRDQ